MPISRTDGFCRAFRASDGAAPKAPATRLRRFASPPCPARGRPGQPPANQQIAANQPVQRRILAAAPGRDPALSPRPRPRSRRGGKYPGGGWWPNRGPRLDVGLADRAPALLISRLVSWVDDLWCRAIGAGV
nr:Acetoacetyl-CoA synthetase / Long-chain-fatty-acid--CoA ligase [Mycobacterium pseudoshottsii]